MPNIPIDSLERGFSINRLKTTNDAWYVGRADMQYRDLIPGRLGGRFIASHIRIPDGGETPDYVHYHKAIFQMIYCKAGWARVVYEDQGPPFALEAGDCVLQPPEIRHRVLESSPGLEVIEVACPAEYETCADNEMLLPTSEVLPERLFGGQRFALHRAREASWAPWRLEGFEARDTGVAAGTNGLAWARVVKSKAGGSAITAMDGGRAGELSFLFILQGGIRMDCRAQGSHQLLAGDSCVIPADMDYTLRADAGLEMLEVCLSAELTLSSSYAPKTDPRP
jgi:mannose-6-phosphate isomerase-like protein (cupin superfamily)